MASPLDKLFAPFEGERDPLPIAIFRIAFFGGLAIHFFPALCHLDDNYAPGVLRSDEWSHWLFVHVGRLPHAALEAAALVTMLAVLMCAVGLFTRIAAIVSGLGLYAFASANGLPVQTLALLDAWAILILWMICGGGEAALSLDALRRRKAGPRREPKLLSSLILFQILIAVFFSGIEKLLAGWPGSNEMGLLFSYPKGFLVRDWLWATPWLHGAILTRTLSWLTLFVELGTPILLLVRRTRLAALLVYEAFFVGIIAMLEVPPLFYFIFAFGALLALDGTDLRAIATRLGRPRR